MVPRYTVLTLASPVRLGWSLAVFTMLYFTVFYTKNVREDCFLYEPAEDSQNLGFL